MLAGGYSKGHPIHKISEYILEAKHMFSSLNLVQNSPAYKPEDHFQGLFPWPPLPFSYL